MRIIIGNIQPKYYHSLSCITNLILSWNVLSVLCDDSKVLQLLYSDPSAEMCTLVCVLRGICKENIDTRIVLKVLRPCHVGVCVPTYFRAACWYSILSSNTHKHPQVTRWQLTARLPDKLFYQSLENYTPAHDVAGGGWRVRIFLTCLIKWEAHCERRRHFIFRSQLDFWAATESKLTQHVEPLLTEVLSFLLKQKEESCELCVKWPILNTSYKKRF